MGTFEVHALMMTNTCGPQAVSIPAALQYQARLGYNRGVASWELPQSRISATGSWTDVPPSFRFTNDTYRTVREAVPVYGLAACVMHRFDVIEGTLSGSLHDLAAEAAALDANPMDGLDATEQLVPDDAGTDAGPASIAATETIAYGPSAGSDCRDAIGVGQGQFLTLPCQITYAMNGVMTQ
jgi:hypothetical protein